MIYIDVQDYDPEEDYPFPVGIVVDRLDPKDAMLCKLFGKDMIYEDGPYRRMQIWSVKNKEEF